MSANSLRNSSGAPEPGRRVQDEWGFFDPQQAGLPALARVSGDERPAPAATATGIVTMPPDAGRIAHCSYCTEPLPADATQCPLCLRDVIASNSRVTHAMPVSATHPSGKAQNGAVYTLESPARCPECHQDIRTIRVLRVLRTQVSFTSTLPRKGYVIICPECERLLSAELSGLI